MSSKTIHTIAGAAVGGALIYAYQPDFLHGAMLLLGSHAGASAPDWMEMPVWVNRHHWFRANESHRYSLIPHRTITHTLSLWMVAFGYLAYQLTTASNSYLNQLAFGFIGAVLTHLLLDVRTPMGIPLWPFGRRYRLEGLRLRAAHAIQARQSW